jgi:hypothetical protein
VFGPTGGARRTDPGARQDDSHPDRFGLDHGSDELDLGPDSSLLLSPAGRSSSGPFEPEGALLPQNPHDDHVPHDAHRPSADEAESAGALLFPDQPDTIASTAVEEGPSASGHPAGGRRPTRKTAARRCIAVTRDGRPCRAPAQPSAPTCIFHDESRADEAAAARRLGGQHRRRVRATGPGVDFNGLGTADAIRSTLELAVADLLDLEPSIPRSRVLIAAAGVAMRLLELTDLAAEVAVLKAANRAMRPRLDPPTADFDSTITDPSEGDE